VGSFSPSDREERPNTHLFDKEPLVARVDDGLEDISKLKIIIWV